MHNVRYCLNMLQQVKFGSVIAYFMGTQSQKVFFFVFRSHFYLFKKKPQRRILREQNINLIRIQFDEYGFFFV